MTSLNTNAESELLCLGNLTRSELSQSPNPIIQKILEVVGELPLSKVYLLDHRVHLRLTRFDLIMRYQDLPLKLVQSHHLSVSKQLIGLSDTITITDAQRIK